MVDFFDRFYTSIINKNRLLHKIRFYSLLRLCVRLIVNIIVPIYFRITKNNKNYFLKESEKTDGRIIVTLTSFPARINRVWLVIESLLRQTKKPDKIMLWLSKDQFESMDILPARLLKLRLRGVEIMLEEGDLRSHKKYFYVLKNFPNDYMLTIDDDIFYRSTMVENLFNYINKYPQSVISQYSKQIIWKDDHLTPYVQWPTLLTETIPNNHTFFGTGGGALFPPKSMDADVLNKDLFMSVTPTADDIWLNAMCRLNKTRIMQTSYHSAYIPVINFRNVALHSGNINESLNDRQLELLTEYYINYKGVDPYQEDN